MPAQQRRPLSAIVPAAGEGKRMRSGTPKVLHPLCGRPMVLHTLDVLATAPGATNPTVWSVDVDGWRQTSLLPSAPFDVVSIASAPGQPLVVGTKNNEIQESRNDFWQVVGTGTNPSYPG